MSACGKAGSKISTFGPKSGFAAGFFCANAAGAQAVMTIPANMQTMIAKCFLALLKNCINLGGRCFPIPNLLHWNSADYLWRMIAPVSSARWFISPSGITITTHGESGETT